MNTSTTVTTDITDALMLVLRASESADWDTFQALLPARVALEFARSLSERADDREAS